MTQRKKLWKELIVFTILTAFLAILVSGMLIRTNFISTVNLSGLYREEKDSLDVVVIGASEVYTGFIPAKAWEEYGFTSYSLGSAGVGGNLYKTLLKEVLATQHPQVVAFEINGFLYGDGYLENEGNIRNITDNMRHSENWVETIRSAVPEEKRIEYYLPYLAYHSRWKEGPNLLVDDYYKVCTAFAGPTAYKGYTTYTYVSPYSELEPHGAGGLTPRTEAVLRDLIAFCKEEGIEQVLFYRAPHISKISTEGGLASIEKVVKETGCDWLNCDGAPKEAGTNIETDFYNADHMNVCGAQRWTSYFGKYLMDHYSIDTTHTDKVVKQWNESAEVMNREIASMEADMEAGVIQRYSDALQYKMVEKKETGEELGGGAISKEKLKDEKPKRDDKKNGEPEKPEQGAEK